MKEFLKYAFPGIVFAAIAAVVCASEVYGPLLGMLYVTNGAIALYYVILAVENSIG